MAELTTASKSDSYSAFKDPDERPEVMSDVFETWLAILHEQTKSAAANTEFKQWLDTHNAFREYSPRNTILIRAQRSDATKVAGYRTWQTEFDRQVKRGESAIWIWAPIHAHKCPECGNSPQHCADSACTYGETPPNQWPKGIVGFRPVPVFDITQTEGTPLPELETSVRGDATQLVPALLAAASTLDVSVEIVSSNEWMYGKANGICDFQAGAGRPHVSVKSDRDATVAHTLAHEYAHAKLHDTTSDETERAAREAEAESVAYLVSRHFELDAENARFYLASWGGDTNDVLRHRLDRISRTATTIIMAVENHLETTS